MPPRRKQNARKRVTSPSFLPSAWSSRPVPYPDSFVDPIFELPSIQAAECTLARIQVPPARLPPEWSVIFLDSFRLGCCIPPSPFGQEILEHFGVRFGQLTPSSWCLVASFDILCTILKMRPTARLFEWFFCREPRERLLGWCSLAPRADTVILEVPRVQMWFQTMLGFKSPFFRECCGWGVGSSSAPGLGPRPALSPEEEEMRNLLLDGPVARWEELRATSTAKHLGYLALDEALWQPEPVVEKSPDWAVEPSEAERDVPQAMPVEGREDAARAEEKEPGLEELFGVSLPADGRLLTPRDVYGEDYPSSESERDRWWRRKRKAERRNRTPFVSPTLDLSALGPAGFDRHRRRQDEGSSRQARPQTVPRDLLDSLWGDPQPRNLGAWAGRPRSQVMAPYWTEEPPEQAAAEEEPEPSDPPPGEPHPAWRRWWQRYGHCFKVLPEFARMRPPQQPLFERPMTKPGRMSDYLERFQALMQLPPSERGTQLEDLLQRRERLHELRLDSLRKRSVEFHANRMLLDDALVAFRDDVSRVLERASANLTAGNPSQSVPVPSDDRDESSSTDSWSSFSWSSPSL